MKFKNKIYFGLSFLFFTIFTYGQSDSSRIFPKQNTPNITEFYNTLGLSIDEISILLTKNNYSLGGENAQRKANENCCRDLNYKENKFFAKYYSNGETDVELVFRNDNKLISIVLIFPTKDIKYMQTAEIVLKNLRFQIVESKRNPKEKTIYKRYISNAISTRRAVIFYSSIENPDTISIADSKLVKEK